VSPSTESGSSSGRTVAAVVLGVIALVFIVAGIVYVAVPAGSLPGFMGHIANSNGHHPLRAAGCLIVGVVFAIGAWFALKYKGKAATSADSASKEPAAR
jgi:protein-S-isoprenylcysteine O-methyltransferase Ste14